MSKIFVAIPAYDGKVCCDTLASVLGNVLRLQAQGHQIAIATDSGNCYLDRTRNTLVKKFLASGYDTMIFVDADMGFETDAFSKLMSVKKSLVFGAYPCKGTSTWTIKPMTGEDGVFDIRPDGTIECFFGPTGLMKIERDAFALIYNAHPEIKVNDTDDLQYFKTGYVCGDGLWSGEDVYFCDLYRKSGGRCWCYLDIKVDHIGISHTAGNCAEFVASLNKGESK